MYYSVLNINFSCWFFYFKNENSSGNLTALLFLLRKLKLWVPLIKILHLVNSKEINLVSCDGYSPGPLWKAGGGTRLVLYQLKVRFTNLKILYFWFCHSIFLYEPNIMISSENMYRICLYIHPENAYPCWQQNWNV